MSGQRYVRVEGHARVRHERGRCSCGWVAPTISEATGEPLSQYSRDALLRDHKLDMAGGETV